MPRKILLITGDGGESYEALYARHRFLEEGFEPAIAAPTKKRLNLVMHDFEPGWDTYIEKPGYQQDADLTINDARARNRASAPNVKPGWLLPATHISLVQQKGGPGR